MAPLRAVQHIWRRGQQVSGTATMPRPSPLLARKDGRLPMAAPGSMVTLHIPEIANDIDTLTAALAYAEHGWYVLPVKMDTKHPGSVVGSGWPSLSSRDPKNIAAWFAGSDYGIALHCGRSGAVVLDVDTHENTPDEVIAATENTNCPYQSTRPNEPGRGHYIFANTTGRRIGNGLGHLATEKKWGEVRGANGVIIV